eukprot:m51a1_g2289 hypothetical protein (605) ;mRNA; r:408896-410871
MLVQVLSVIAALAQVPVLAELVPGTVDYVLSRAAPCVVSVNLSFVHSGASRAPGGHAVTVHAASVRDIAGALPASAGVVSVVFGAEMLELSHDGRRNVLCIPAGPRGTVSLPWGDLRDVWVDSRPYYGPTRAFEVGGDRETVISWSANVHGCRRVTRGLRRVPAVLSPVSCALPLAALAVFCSLRRHSRLELLANLGPRLHRAVNSGVQLLRDTPALLLVFPARLLLSLLARGRGAIKRLEAAPAPASPAPLGSDPYAFACVLSMLSRKDISAVALTCRAWNDLVQRSVASGALLVASSRPRPTHLQAFLVVALFWSLYAFFVCVTPLGSPAVGLALSAMSMCATWPVLLLPRASHLRSESLDSLLLIQVLVQGSRMLLDWSHPAALDLVSASLTGATFSWMVLAAARSKRLPARAAALNVALSVVPWSCAFFYSPLWLVPSAARVALCVALGAVLVKFDRVIAFPLALNIGLVVVLGLVLRSSVFLSMVLSSVLSGLMLSALFPLMAQRVIRDHTVRSALVTSKFSWWRDLLSALPEATVILSLSREILLLHSEYGAALAAIRVLIVFCICPPCIAWHGITQANAAEYYPLSELSEQTAATVL